MTGARRTRWRDEGAAWRDIARYVELRDLLEGAPAPVVEVVVGSGGRPALLPRSTVRTNRREELLAELADLAQAIEPCLPEDALTRRCVELTASGVSSRCLIERLEAEIGQKMGRTAIQRRVEVGRAEMRGAMRASGLLPGRPRRGAACAGRPDSGSSQASSRNV